MHRCFSAQNDLGVGSNAWWLTEVSGANYFDKLIIGATRSVYLALRGFSKLILGMKKRDQIWLRRNINFQNFLYTVTSKLGLREHITLKLTVPKYDYTICCPLNKEDFIIVTRHEDEILEHFKPKDGDTVIDIGAHMGRYTIISSKRIGEGGKVIAIEAHPYNLKFLRQSIKLNNLTNVVMLNLAVSSSIGITRLFLPEHQSTYTMHHSIRSDYLTSKYKVEPRHSIQVNSKTLDNIVQDCELNKVNWIKIDVEGAELEVLKGASFTLSSNTDISVLIEVHTADAYASIVELFKKLDMQIVFEKSYNAEERHIIGQKSKHSNLL